MKIVLNSGNNSNLFRIMELLNKSTVLSARVLLEKCMITNMFVNGKLMDQGLNYPQIPSFKLLIWKNLKKVKNIILLILKSHRDYLYKIIILDKKT